MHTIHTSLVAAVLLLATACGSESTSTHSYTFIDSDGGGDITIDGVQIDIEPPVRYVYRSESSSASGTERTMILDGHDFGVRDGIFFVGDIEYAAVKEGDTVLVDGTGVHVNGERKGEMPAAKTDG